VTFGGLGKDEGWDVAVDAAGRAHVVGATESVNFPTNTILDTINGPYSVSGTLSGSSDAFISVINSNGSAFEYSVTSGERARISATAWRWMRSETHIMSARSG
jgi:hypothetical protein